MATKMKNANVSQTNKAKESKQVKAGVNLGKDVFGYARRKDGEISTFKLKQAAAKEMNEEKDSISGAIKTLNLFSGKKLDLMLKYGKLAKADVLTPKFMFEHYSKVTNCYFKDEKAWYNYSTTKEGQKIVTGKERKTWSANFLFNIIEAAIK
jgi:hypothetical protein